MGFLKNRISLSLFGLFSCQDHTGNLARRGLLSSKWRTGPLNEKSFRWLKAEQPRFPPHLSLKSSLHHRAFFVRLFLAGVVVGALLVLFLVGLVVGALLVLFLAGMVMGAPLVLFLAGVSAGAPRRAI